MHSPPKSMDQPAHHRWLRLGVRLVVATLAYNVLEAGVALWWGVIARRIVLVGFGLNSVLETMAAGITCNRFK